MAERRLTAVQSLKRAVHLRGSRRARPDAGHRELDGEMKERFERHVYFSAEERGSRFDRLRTVEASLATSSSLVEDR